MSLTTAYTDAETLRTEIIPMWPFSLFFGKKSEPTNGAQKPDTALSEGYTPQYIEARIEQMHGKLVELGAHAEVLERFGADEDHSIKDLVFKVNLHVEKVLLNLKANPNDMARTGLVLESFDLVIQQVGSTAEQAAKGIEGKQLETALTRARAGLSKAAADFELLHKVRFQTDDGIRDAGLSNAYDALRKHNK